MKYISISSVHDVNKLIIKTVRQILEARNKMAKEQSLFTAINHDIVTLIQDKKDSKKEITNTKDESLQLLYHLLSRPEELVELYDCLCDKLSRETLIWYMQLRIGYYFLSEHTYKVFPPYIAIKTDHKNPSLIIKTKRNGSRVRSYFIRSPSYLIKESWCDETYLLRDICEPQPGDFVISAGANRGETSIWFAEKMNQNGMIYAFEPSRSGFQTLKKNILNNHLSHVIEPVNQALWDKNDEPVFLASRYARSDNQLTAKKSGSSVGTVTLDTFMKQKRLPRVNYIKMDVEGAELKVLQGAAETIKKHRPALAIAAYHKADDLFAFTSFLKELWSGYSFYLSQKSRENPAPVLFAVNREKEVTND